MSSYLNQRFAEALGLPKHTTRAVLTLQIGRAPTIKVTSLLTDSVGQFVIVNAQDQAKEIAQIDFSYRLVRFGEKA